MSERLLTVAAVPLWLISAAGFVWWTLAQLPWLVCLDEIRRKRQP